MGRFDKGIQNYTACDLTMTVWFPEDEVKCRWCPFITHYDSIDRDKCFLTQEILYSRDFTGLHCPLKVINNIDSEEMKE